MISDVHVFASAGEIMHLESAAGTPSVDLGSNSALGSSSALPQYSVTSPVHYCQQTNSQTPEPLTHPQHYSEEDKISKLR